MSEHAINPDLFEQLPLAASVRLYTADRRDSEVIHASDLVVTLPNPKDVLPPAADTGEPSAHDDSFVVNDESITLSQAFGAPLALELEQYYEQPHSGPAPDGVFESDDEYHEINYQPVPGKKKKVTCMAQELYHAEVAELRRDEGTSQTYAKLMWFYRGRDFPKASSLAGFVNAMGRDELVKSTHFTINEAEGIFGLSELVCFSASRCDLRPIGHNDTFSISGGAPGREHANRVVGVVEFQPGGAARWKGRNAPEICLEHGCKLKRRYFPSQHVVRWCEGCSRWFHLSCLERYTHNITASTVPAVLYAGQDRRLQLNHPHFAKALISPIQRAPPSFWTGDSRMTRQFPLSFEIVIMNARAFWLKSQGAPPTDEYAWLMFNLGYSLEHQGANSRLVAEVEHRIEQFKRIPIPALYECGQCDQLV